MTRRLVLVMALAIGLITGCSRVQVDAAGSASEVEHWSVGIRF